MSAANVSLSAPEIRDSRDYEKLEAEIARKALLNLTNEMALALINTSGSPVVFEVKDFCTCLLDEKGEQLSYSSYALLHAGSARVGTRATIAQIRLDKTEIRPGDAWILNDPFKAGSAHQGDIAVLTPVFYESEHLGWCYTSMHVMDVGGSGISGYAPGARTFYEEGLLFPPTRVVTGGKIDSEWERFIRANVRLPGLVMSDIRSMMASNNVGQKKLTEVVRQFGLERFRRYCSINNDLTEAAFRRRIERMRDGVYETTEWVEFDGHGTGEQLFEVRVRLEVDGSDLRFSFSGAPQQPAFINAAEGQVTGNAVSAILTVLCYGDLPFNAGFWRPLHFDLGPPGSIVNAIPPAAMSAGHSEAGFRVAKGVKDVLVQALALSDDPVLRGRVAGQPQDGFAIAGLAGLNQEGDPTIIFLLDSSVGSGGAAQTTGDGQDVYFLTAGTGAGLAQVETHESRQPILFLWRRLLPNSGGAGFQRGGQSIDEAYMLRYSDEVSGSATNSCAQVPPRGYGGGLPASSGDYWPIYGTNAEQLMAGGRAPVHSALTGRITRVPSKCGQLSLARGDALRLLSGGGGGLGDPLLRDPERVARDVRDVYVTEGNANSAYGVILNSDGTVDARATDLKRAEIRTTRIGGPPKCVQSSPASVGIAVVLKTDAAGMHWACGYCGEGFCRADSNWRRAVITKALPVADYYERMGMHVRPRLSAPDVIAAECYCTACAGLLAVEIYPSGFEGFSSPQLRATNG
jgi:N-methylhydantoinase B